MKWLRVGSFATLDQVWLSAINFAISIVFIRYATKAEYGIYILLLTPIFFIQGIQNALFLSPFGTLFPQRAINDRFSAVQFLAWGQLTFILAVACLGFTSLITYQFLTDKVIFPTAIAFALAISGILAREATRSFQYVNGHAGKALIGDIVFGTFVLLALAISINMEAVSAATILAITGIAGLLPLSRLLIHKNKYPPLINKTEIAFFWACGRWAVIGVCLTWISLNLYPYIAAASFGVEAVAEINAARLFMMPLMLGLPAWSNLFRPKFSRWFAQRQLSNMKSASLKFAAYAGIVVLIYSGIVFAAYPFLEMALGNSYASILPLVIAWAIFYFVSSIRTVFMANLMVDEAGYKAMTRYTFLTLFAFVPAMFLASHSTAVWIIGSLILTELIQVVAIVFKAKSYWRGNKSV